MANTQTINTRIVQRNDLASEWEKVKNSAKLMVGEVGIETDTGLFKIGRAKEDGTLYTWGELEYANEMQVRVVASLNDLVGRKIGDMVIVEAPLYEGSTQKTRTAYVWQEVVDAEGNKTENWAALDGNYSAENVYFDADIVLAGTYTRVGNVTKTSTSATGTLSSKGKSLSQVMQTIFTEDQYPHKNTSGDFNKPTLSISGLGSNENETGSTYTLPTATVTVSDVGSYLYAPTNTNSYFPKPAEATETTRGWSGITLTQSNKTTNVSTSSADMDTGDTLTLKAVAVGSTDGTYTDSAQTYSFSASGEYTAGQAPKTNLGVVLDNNDNQGTWTYRLKEGTATASGSASYTGYRKMFVGNTTALSLDSATIRALSLKSAKAATTANIEVTVPEGATNLIIACPTNSQGYGYTLSSVQMYSNGVWDGYTGKFEAQLVDGKRIQVADNSGDKGFQEYNVYMYKFSALKADTKFRYTLASKKI